MAYSADQTRFDPTFQYNLSEAQYKLLQVLYSVLGDFGLVLKVLEEQEPLLWESMEDMAPEVKAMTDGVEGIIAFLKQTCQVVKMDADRTALSGQVAQFADNVTAETARGIRKAG